MTKLDLKNVEPNYTADGIDNMLVSVIYGITVLKNKLVLKITIMEVVALCCQRSFPTPTIPIRVPSIASYFTNIRMS